MLKKSFKSTLRNGITEFTKLSRTWNFIGFGEEMANLNFPAVVGSSIAF